MDWRQLRPIGCGATALPIGTVQVVGSAFWSRHRRLKRLFISSHLSFFRAPLARAFPGCSTVCATPPIKNSIMALSSLHVRSSTSVTFKAAKPVLSTSLPRRRVITAAASVKTKAGKALNYVCLDCGYIYTDTKVAFDALPGSYACPACSAPKRRFKTLDSNTSKSNNQKAMDERRETLRDQIEAAGGNPDEGDQEPLLLFGGAAVAFFAAVTYFVSNR